MFALIDCNNFFVSCERVFDPLLQNVPVAILSNNDGCIVSRSNEVKRLGIPMGAPVFKYRDDLNRLKVRLLSSNYTLYSDMSRRVMSSLASLVSDIQIYSIDEAFVELTLSGRDKNYTDVGRSVRERILQWTGVPVSVGIAATKTLAKAAGEIAKKDLSLGGVMDISSRPPKEQDQLLDKLDVGDVWGVGYRTVPKLHQEGIYTALQLKHVDPTRIQSLYGITFYRTVLELRGIPCFNLQTTQPSKKGIACTRSFGHRVTSLRELEEAVAMYTTSACEKLREQNCLARSIYVFIHTDPHKQGESFYSNGRSVELSKPEFKTGPFLLAATAGLRQIFIPGKRYKKAGVYISNIYPRSHVQLGLFDYEGDSQWERQSVAMGAIDHLNRQWGRGTVRLAQEGFKRAWFMKRDRVSKRYTTRWDELPVAR